jgi:hypothetical protein
MRLRAVTGTEQFRRAAPVLAEATLRTAPPAFEQALRAAIAGLRDSMARLEAEIDPLSKHLGFRALNRDVAARGVDPEQLSRPDEQQYAGELLRSARGREAQTFVGLDPAARLDLEVLLQLERRLHERDALAARRAAADQAQAKERDTAERLERDLVRERETVEKAPAVTRPLWLRLLGVAAALLSFAFAAALAAQPHLLGAWLDGLPAVRWSSVLGALLLGALGSWLGTDPAKRRAWLLAQVEALTESGRLAKAREREAAEALTRARKLFEEVDAECRREEAAALAVLQRRPGAARYVSTTGTVVVFDVE